MEHPSEVCRVIALFALSLTPSMMSISPSLGQFGPTIQKAGLVGYQQCFRCEEDTDMRKNLPCAANSARHVGDIEGKQAVVVGCVTRDTYAISAATGSNISAIDTHVDKPVAGVYVAIVGCC